MTEDRNYWFSAKTHGWGWGLPSAWQGWVVYATFAVLLVAAVFVFPPTEQPEAFGGCVVALAVLLLGICWLKGEPPGWRWGGK